MTSDARTTPLDDQLCFALHAASRAMTGLYREPLDALGLTYTQYLVLLCLWEKDGQTMRELGPQLQMDSATLTPVAKRLETRGLLTRQRDPRDERRVVLTLTDQARALEPAVRAIQCQVTDSTQTQLDDLLRLRDELIELTSRMNAS